MFCLASRYQTSSDRLGEVSRIFQEQAIPLVSRQPGFKGVYLMSQPNGRFMVLNIWETEEQANTWLEHAKNQQVITQLKPLLIGAISYVGYEVRAHSIESAR